MPRGKRKQPADDAVSARGNKRHKQESTLTDLPREILDIILDATIPDPKDFRWAVDKYGTKELFTAPILQTSASLRSACLELINTKCRWMRIEMPNRLMAKSILTGLDFAPLLPVRYRYLRPSRNSDIVIRVEDLFSVPDRPTRSFNPGSIDIVLPFNVNSLLLACQALTDIVLDLMPCAKLFIRSNSWNGSFKLDMQDIIVPILSTIDIPETVMYETDSKTVEIVPSRPKRHHLLSADLDDLTVRAKETLNCAQTLELSGYHDESQLLLLYQTELLSEAENFLPDPCEWEPGNQDCTGTHATGLNQLACCRHGNQLRDILCTIEQKTCIGYVHLIKKYGSDWGQQQEFLDFGNSSRMLSQPAFTWLGQSVSDMAKFHYARAYCYRMNSTVAFETYGFLHYNPEWESYGIKPPEHIESFVQLFFAYHLDPENVCYKAEYEARTGPLSHTRRRKLEEIAESRFVFLEDTLIENGTGRIVWVGDSRMLGRYAGEQFIKNLSIMQQGLEIMPTIEEWLRCCNFSHNKQDKFIKQGQPWSLAP